MMGVQLTVWADHLRFHPESEIHTLILYMNDQWVKAFGIFFLVSSPVSQGPGVILAALKPAII